MAGQKRLPAVGDGNHPALHGSDTSTALSNLLLVTGNYGKPGTGGYPMRGHNNVQGASDFGCLRNMYPGYDKVTDESARQRWAKGWGVDPSQLSNEVGEGNFLMVQSADQGDIKAMYVIGEETAFPMPILITYIPPLKILILWWCRISFKPYCGVC
ncbi:hypothetical protein HSBAA_PA_1400 (plasmid) [Vreelandella sulfidaeris]|uniref:Uncharacterized protein n=1 Tax=Vreelandella sulfidaeris TaxID=115553 RepID=A0A455UIG2_9GAMM|nr:hypothetical protein HSBAA_PA_1400 [Halomonas sulfidaeris]